MTDRIFIQITRTEARRIKKAAPRDVLDQIAKDKFTSCSGFISYYDPDVSTWGRVDEWDQNQLGALIEAFVAEHELMEDARCNGMVEQWLYEENAPVLNRLIKIREYLQLREARPDTPRAGGIDRPGEE